MDHDDREESGEERLLEEAVLAVLGRRSLGDRLLRRGRTVRQVLDALPAGLVPAPDAISPVAVEQARLGRVREVLEALEARGRVQRHRARVRHFLGTKGGRMVEVDVFRPA